MLIKCMAVERAMRTTVPKFVICYLVGIVWNQCFQGSVCSSGEGLVNNLPIDLAFKGKPYNFGMNANI